MLSEQSLLTKYKDDLQEKTLGFQISHMFEFRDPKEISNCVSLLEKNLLPSDDSSVIEINNKDGLIDLSPCIGIYREAFFFTHYNIDAEIEQSLKFHQLKKKLIHK